MKQKNNLIFITTDQQRFDSLRAYGFAQAKTPNLDRLCEEGTVFERCYVTAPICVPCRSTMMTGLYPSVLGTLNNVSWMDENIPTWPMWASKQGIRTSGIGKMHFAPWDILAGFEERIICEDKRHYYIPDDHYRFLEDNGKKRISPVQFPQYKETCGAPFYPYSSEYYPDLYIADRAVEWIDEHSDEQFATWVSFIGPHDPYDPPEEYKDLYRVEDMPDPIPMAEDLSDKTAYQLCNEERPGKYTSVFQCDYMSATTEQRKYWKKNYMTNISVIDEGIGRIFALLDKKDLWKNTTVVFTSDHGDALGDHGLVFKKFFYESMTHVPLIVKGPGVPANERRSALVSTADLVPYFLDVLEVEHLEHEQGVSLKKAIDEPEAALHDFVFSENEGHYMVFDGRYKLSYFVGRISEFYDLQEDPNEMVNEIANPKYQDIIAKFKDELIKHMDECNVFKTRMCKKIACEKRVLINKIYKEGGDIFNL